MIKINKLVLNKELTIIAKYDNKTLIKKYNLTNEFTFRILNDYISGNNKILIINTSFPGYLKIRNDIIRLIKGENRINLENIIKKYKLKGEEKIEIKLCNGNYCKTYYSTILIGSVPSYCKITIIKNNFPRYLIFNFSVKDQTFENYEPKLVYFDMPIYPYREKSYLVLKFPTFYKAQTFDIKMSVDGLVCKKEVNLSYEKYFYAYSSPLEKKLNITRIFLINPYNKSFNLTIENCNNTFNVTLSNKPIILKGRFCKTDVIYKNKVIYSFYPEVKQSSFLQEINKGIVRLIIVIFTLVVVFNVIVFIMSRKKEIVE